MENIQTEIQKASAHHFAPHSTCFMGLVGENNVPETNSKGFSPTVDKNSCRIL
jgi:hypothetical protein